MSLSRYNVTVLWYLSISCSCWYICLTGLINSRLISPYHRLCDFTRFLRYCSCHCYHRYCSLFFSFSFPGDALQLLVLVTGVFRCYSRTIIERIKPSCPMESADFAVPCANCTAVKYPLTLFTVICYSSLGAQPSCR